MDTAYLLNNSAIAKRMRDAGRSWEEIAVALFAQLQLTEKRALDAESIAPKRYGNMIWTCPPELIPDSSIGM